jgi:hypothetical protein
MPAKDIIKAKTSLLSPSEKAGVRTTEGEEKMKHHAFFRRSLAGTTMLCAAVAMAFSLAGLPQSAEAASADSTATSVSAFGGMDGLVAAAKKEGELNVIALPPDWANYGEMIKAFQTKYGIKVNSAQPDADSQDELNAAKRLQGQNRAPDVFDLGVNVALSAVPTFAPYKVAGWDDIADNLKDPNGAWFADYGGYASIGYDAKQVPAITSVADLLKPEFKGKVALNRKRRLRRRYCSGGRFLQEAAPVRQHASRRSDPRHHCLRSDPCRHRLGISEPGAIQDAKGLDRLEGRGSAGRTGRRLLCAGDQQGCAASGRCTPLGGIPLF